MAIVPKSQRRVTQLRNIPESALRRDTAVPEQFGLTQARELGQIGRQLQREGLERFRINRERKQKAEVRDALNEFAAFSREYNSQMYDLKGKNATEIYPKSQEAYEEAVNKIGNRFTNPAQRELFFSNSNSTTQNSLTKILKHQENQISNYEDMTLDAENQSFIDNAVQNRFDPEYIRNQEAGIVANTRFKNEKYGLDGEAAKQNLEAAVNNFNVKVLESYQSPSEANKYLEANWDRFDPAVRTELKERIDKQLEEIFIREKTLELSTSGLTLEQQLAEVDKIKDPDQARAIRAGVKTRYNEKEAIRNAEYEQYKENEWDKLFENPLEYVIPIKDLDSNTQRQMLAFKNQAIDDYKQKTGTGGVVKTDKILYNKLINLPDEELLNTDINKYAGQLNLPEFKEIVKLKKAIRENDAQAERIRTPHQQAKDKITGMKEFDADEGDYERDNLNRYLEQFIKKLALIPEEEQTEERVGQLLDSLLEPVSIRRPGRNKLFRFDIPYLEEKKEQNLILGRRVPENLQELANLNFDERTQQYYVDYDNIREVYDPVSGELIAKGRRIDG